MRRCSSRAAGGRTGETAGSSLTLLASAVQLAQLPSQAWLPVLVGALIAMLAGVFPVRVPGAKNSFAAGEIFIFLLLLIHGPGLAALAMYSAGSVLHAALGPLQRSPGGLILATMAFSLGYVVINTLRQAVVAEGIETAGQVDQLRELGCELG